MLSQAQVGWKDTLFSGRLRTVSRNKRNANWDCRLPETLIGDYFVIPLVSVKMLKSEGYWMNNCCREYAQQCAAQNYCLFSIRTRSGERQATLGLTREGGSWMLDQCCGPANAEVLEETLVYLDEDDAVQTEWVPTEMYYIAQEVVRLMNSPGSDH